MNYIFDFDGTIADSMEAIISIFNEYIRNEENPLTEKEIANLRNMPSRKALRMAGVQWWQMPRLALRFKSEYMAMVPGLKTFDGLKDALERISKRGDQMFIVSSNSKDAVEEFIRDNQLDTYFTKAYCGSSLFKKSKDIRRAIKDYKLKRTHTVYVGDETRDVKAARMARVKPASVTWGFNSAAILKKQKPKFMIHSPKELLNINLDIA